MRLQPVLAAVLCCALFCATGCVSNNIRTAQFGNISARAHLEKGVASFREIEISQPLNPATRGIWLKLPDGKIIDRTWFNYNTLIQAGFERSADQDFQPSNTYTHELKRYGASFLFNMGDLKTIQLYETQGPAISIGPERAVQFYTLPLTQEQLEQLFGMPEKVTDSFHL